MSARGMPLARDRVPELAPPGLGALARRWGAHLAAALAELYKSKTALAGLIMLLLLAGACVLTPFITRYDPVKTDFARRLEPPSAEHYFGTDHYGRDIYARVLWGGRRLVSIALASVVFGLLLGVPLGILSGYLGGWTDVVSMRFVDGLLAFPGLLLYLLFVTLAREWRLEGGQMDLVLVVALGIAAMPEFARLARGAALAEKRKEYVEACEVLGESRFRIAMTQIFPNCISPLIVNATVRLGYVILIVAALSYLGLGTPPPIPDWGADLRAAQAHMETKPYLAVFPGLAICYAVLSFNLFGDGLRDILDPRISGR